MEPDYPPPSRAAGRKAPADFRGTRRAGRGGRDRRDDDLTDRLAWQERRDRRARRDELIGRDPAGAARNAPVDASADGPTDGPTDSRIDGRNDGRAGGTGAVGQDRRPTRRERRRDARRAHRRRRLAAGLLSGMLTLAAGAGLARGLTACQPVDSDPTARPLSAAEADRLAGMRLRNYQDGRAGVRATIGRPGRELRATGWVDWRRGLTYLAVTAPGPWRGDGGPTDPFRPGEPAPAGPVDGLVQAAPGVVATRMATDPVTGEAAGVPPLAPPDTGWVVRRMALAAPGQAPVDALAALLLTIASSRADGAEALARSNARWMRRDLTAGVPVDVLLGPAVPPPAPAATPTSPAPAATPIGRATPTARTVPARAVPARAVPAGATPAQATPAQATPAQATPTGTTQVPPTAGPEPAPTSLARMGGAVRYWLDGTSRVHRLEALIDRDVPVTIDLVRDDRRQPAAIAALGGRPIAPRAVASVESATLARLRQRNRTAGGGRIELTVPAEGGLVRGTGWVDWRRMEAYLRLTGPGHPAPGTVLRADALGVATRRAPKGGGPGLGPTRDLDPAWTFSRWAARADRQGAYDLELLLSELLTLAAPTRESAAARPLAARLRADRVRGQAVTVYELPKPAERDVPAGRARLRYWVAGDGVLRRLELRTRRGVFAQLDVAPGRPPART